MEGNRTAFEQLVELTQEEIFRMIYYRTNSRADAEDLAQEVFLQAYKKVGRLKSADQFRGWLYSIALNRVRDFHRSRRFKNLFSEWDESSDMSPSNEPHQNDAGASPLDSLAREAFWTRLTRSLEQLSRWEREVFMLRFMDQLSLREISRALTKSESTVKTHLYRALKKLKSDASLFELLKEESA